MRVAGFRGSVSRTAMHHAACAVLLAGWLVPVRRLDPAVRTGKYQRLVLGVEPAHDERWGAVIVPDGRDDTDPPVVMVLSRSALRLAPR